MEKKLKITSPNDKTLKLLKDQQNDLLNLKQLFYSINQNNNSYYEDFDNLDAKIFEIFSRNNRIIEILQYDRSEKTLDKLNPAG